MRLDALDSSILKHLLEDARLSFRDLAERVSSTTPTVSARVKALQELGIIRGYHAELNPDILGGPLRILVVRCKPSAAARIAEALAKQDAVERVDVLAGGRIHAHVRERLHQGVRTPHALLAGDPDIVSYDSEEVLATPRRSPPALDPEGVDVPCHQCKGPIHGSPIRAKIEGRAHVFCCQHCLETFQARVRGLKVPAKAGPHHH